jgi:hypothetical protein
MMKKKGGYRKAAGITWNVLKILSLLKVSNKIPLLLCKD